MSIPTEPTRIQTCYLHRDPTVKPDIQDPHHHVNVFYEDRIHDWTWIRGELKYSSRAMEGGCWIRCEFEVSRYQVKTEGFPDSGYSFKSFGAAKAEVTRQARKSHVLSLRAYDMTTGEVFRYDPNQSKTVQVTP